MFKTKKFFTLGLVAIMSIMLLAACNSDGDENE